MINGGDVVASDCVARVVIVVAKVDRLPKCSLGHDALPKFLAVCRNGRGVSLGVSETVKFVARHIKLSDLLRIFNLARALSHLRGKSHFLTKSGNSGTESGPSALATNLTVSDTPRDRPETKGRVTLWIYDEVSSQDSSLLNN